MMRWRRHTFGGVALSWEIARMTIPEILSVVWIVVVGALCDRLRVLHGLAERTRTAPRDALRDVKDNNP
jgi:hypothetical protein